MSNETLRTRSAALLLTAFAALGLAAGAAQAGEGVDGDLRGGYNADAEEGFVGGGVLTGVGGSGRWFANPNAEVVFVDAGNQVNLSGDFHYDFIPSGPTDVWLGAGPTVIHRDRDAGASDDTDLGVSLIAGVGARSGAVRPFAQGRIIMADDSEAMVAFGIRF